MSVTACMLKLSTSDSLVGIGEFPTECSLCEVRGCNVSSEWVSGSVFPILSLFHAHPGSETGQAWKPFSSSWESTCISARSQQLNKAIKSPVQGFSSNFYGSAIRAHTTFPEDLNLILSTHVRKLTTSCNSISEECNISSLCRHRMHIALSTQTQNYK